MRLKYFSLFVFFVLSFAVLFADGSEVFAQKQNIQNRNRNENRNGSRNESRNGGATNSSISNTSASSTNVTDDATAGRSTETAGSEHSSLAALLIIIAMIAVTVIVFASSGLAAYRGEPKRNEDEFYNSLNAVENFRCGFYSSGLSPGASDETLVSCVVNQADYVFFTQTGLRVIGSIPRDKIVGVQVETSTGKYKRIPGWAYLMLILGPLGLVFVAFVREEVRTDNHKSSMSWEDERKFVQKTVFEFGENFGAVNAAYNSVSKYALSKT